MTFHQARIFAAASAIAGLAISVPAFAGQADQRASNARARTSQTQAAHPAPRAEARRPAAPPAPPPQASRPQTSRPPAPPAPVARPRAAVAPPAAAQAPTRRGPVTADARQNVQGYAVRRPAVTAPSYATRPAIVAPRAVVVAPRPAWRAFRPGFGAPLHIVRFYSPYYAFRPRFSFGFGLMVGYPVAYPDWYDPYPYYGYALGAGVAYGGLSFDIQPPDAAVFVDGAYVGIVGDFSSYNAPLTLRAGLHRVEISAENCQPLDFDITVVPGQVIPYRGTLSPQ